MSSKDKINYAFLDEDTLKDRFMSFKIDKIDYAIELGFITEIVSIQKITEVPNTKPHILGIINLRGSIIPVVSLRKRFGLEEAEYSEKTCIIVVSIENNNIGLLVDEVSEVLSISDSITEPPPITNKGSQSKFITGIGKVGSLIVTILNIKNLLF